MQDSSAFGTAEQAIINAFELRLVTPDVGEARGFTDLQGKCQGFWLTLLLFPEVAGKVPRRHEMPPFPGPFGLKGGF